MHQDTLITRVKLDCESTTRLIFHDLTQAGFDVVRSFDLQAARSSHLDCPCPNHGTDKCTCQIVVLLVYGYDLNPLALIIHSLDENTHISMVENPQQKYPHGFHDLIKNTIDKVEA